MKRHLLLILAFLFSSNIQAAERTEAWKSLCTTDAVSVKQEWKPTQNGANIVGGTINIAGREFSHGIGTHAPGEIVFDLSGRNHKLFRTFVGVDVGGGPSSSVTFTVMLDGKTAFESGVMKQGESAREVRLNIEGVKELKLVCGDAGNGVGGDWANWAEAAVDAVFLSEDERKLYFIKRLAAKYSAELKQLAPHIEYALRDPFSLSLMIDDLEKTFPERFDAKSHRAEWSRFFDRLAELAINAENDDETTTRESYLKLAAEYDTFQREVALANPLLDFDRLLFVRRPPGRIITPGNNAYTTDDLPKNVESELCYLEKNSSAWTNPRIASLYKSDKNRTILDPDLDFDGQKVLFSMPGENGRWHLFEQKIDSDESAIQVTQNLPEVDAFDACYLPDGRIVFGSNACFQGLPCESGRVQMALLYRLDRSSGEIRQLTFEQDSDWCPTVTNDGRVMYLRWEYSDTPHYFSRLLFTMNPDGTNQVAFYGSNSYWPNSLFYAQAIPGSSSKFVGTVSGHHVSRPGRLVLFDAAKGRQEADGVVQAIPGRNQKVEPLIMDYLYDDIRPKFLQVHPLGTSEDDGAGRYFLVAANMENNWRKGVWGIYLVDVFDNITPILVDPAYALTDPIPIRSRTRPRVIPERTVPGEKEATVFITNVYHGPGLKDLPRDKVKSLRLFSYHFSYPHTGHNDVLGIESSWDVKRILGTVPVEQDGSAVFTIPAHTPISIQPLDENGAALQLMRSWMVGMQGETVSCIGCHESQNDVTPSVMTSASRRAPRSIEPWKGKVRGYDFLREVQPVLDKYCIGCHDGTQADSDEIHTTGTNDLKGRPNFKDYRLITVTDGENRQIGPFHRSYVELRPYVRTPGPESDYHLFNPMEYHVSTSPLFQMLQAGHHGVELDEDAKERLTAWVDLNAPCYGTWTEAHRYWANKVLLDWMGIDNKKQMEDLEKYRELRNHYSELYADISVDPESETVPEREMALRIERFRRENPPFMPRLPVARAAVSTAWSFDAEEASARQNESAPNGKTERKFDLNENVAITFRWIPPEEFDTPQGRKRVSKGFWLGATEITNRQYGLFDPKHDSRYVDEMAKDHTRPGLPANEADQPVSRISLRDAQGFCAWFSETFHVTASLPTETQWEWACRAGTATPLWYGAYDADFSKTANLADANLSRFRRGQGAVDFYRKIAEVNDAQQVMCRVGNYAPNPWGLYDMHGNVAEITRPENGDQAVVKGGCWADWPKRAASSFRVEFPEYQKLPNTGFRIMLEEQ